MKQRDREVASALDILGLGRDEPVRDLDRAQQARPRLRELLAGAVQIADLDRRDGDAARPLHIARRPVGEALADAQALVALAAGAGCSKNSKEALDRAHKAAEAQCDCVADAMNKPRSQIGHNDCDATKTAFYDAMKSVDQSEKQGEEIFNLGHDCIKKLSELSRPPTDSN